PWSPRIAASVPRGCGRDPNHPPACRPVPRRRGRPRKHRLVRPGLRGWCPPPPATRLAAARLPVAALLSPRSSAGRLCLQADQHALRVGKIADDAANRSRKLADQRRDGDNLVGPRKFRTLDQVDDIDLVAPRHMFLAQRFEIRNGGYAARRVPGNIKLELPQARRLPRMFIRRLLPG